MPQLHFYVPDDVAEQIKNRAAQADQPLSRYVAELVKREVSQGWPPGYFERLAAKPGDARFVFEPTGVAEERSGLD
ncbi:MAG: hypothetical protein ACKVQK_08350 [Burkholderiales bacterium]